MFIYIYLIGKIKIYFLGPKFIAKKTIIIYNKQDFRQLDSGFT